MKYNNSTYSGTIKELYYAKKSVSDIAHALNVNSTTIANVLIEQGIKNFPKPNTYAERFDLNAAEFQNIQIDSARFSVRTTNCLKKILVFTVEDLLNCTSEDLSNIKGFGSLSKTEVLNYIASLTKCDPNDLSLDHQENPSTKSNFSLQEKYMLEHREQIYAKDFSFVSDMSLDESIKQDIQNQVRMIKDAYSVLDEDLIQACKNTPQTVSLLLCALREFSEKQKRKDELYDILDSVPISRKNNLAEFYIRAYTDDATKQETIRKFYATGTSQLKSLYLADNLSYDAYLLLKNFLKWCTFDLVEDAKNLWNASCSRENTQVVIHGRAYGHTLEECGAQIGVTRERIRQIEAKAVRIFERNENAKRFIAKVSAEKNGDPIIHRDDIEKYVPNIREFFYLLKSSHNGNYTYDKGLDVLIVGNSSISEKISTFVDDLPEMFNIKRLNSYVSDAAELGLPEDLVVKSIEETYRITGDTYHRSRLSLANVYRDILAANYPNGFYTGSITEINAFRNRVQEKFGNIKLPENDHALVAAVSRIGMLCGKGCYKPKQKEYISQDLANKIHAYIVNSKSSIFLMNTLYEVFENELQEEGVDNKYYLQGILHELYGDEFVFTRDYLSKDGEDTSLYSSIVEFIKNSSFQVDKAQIQRQFPAIPDIVIQFAISSPDVINCFGKYIHASKLRISENEKEYLRRKIAEMVSDGMQHHMRELYYAVNIERPEIFTRNGILYPFSAFSLVEYLFRDDYKFTRPFIAQQGVEITGTSDVLREEVYSHESYDLKELSSFASENHLAINSTLDFIDSCNDEYLMVSNQMMMRISSIGVNEQIAQQVGSIVMREVEETTPIYKVMGLRDLPKINVPWTDWLVYSVLKKWPCDIELAASNKQFRYAIPLVSQKGKMCAEPFEYAYKDPDYNGEIPIFDIDELLAGECGDSILEENLWD